MWREEGVWALLSLAWELQALIAQQATAINDRTLAQDQPERTRPWQIGPCPHPRQWRRWQS